MTIRGGIVVGLAVVAAGCTTPGEPPSHPGDAAYRDVMRREVSTASSALATAQLTLTYLDQNKISTTYALVLAEQAAADLHRVATDLPQIMPPVSLAEPHHRLQLTVTRATREVNAITHRLSVSASRTSTLKRLSSDGDRVDRLANELVG
jgi:hypothetical protein